ncbi:sensor histidine kinase, partial [Nocardiopsis sp. MG754419]|nr:sensor histidine kinase [Nocardiopsis sp. MG754419]
MVWDVLPAAVLGLAALVWVRGSFAWEHSGGQGPPWARPGGSWPPLAQVSVPWWVWAGVVALVVAVVVRRL